MPKAKKIKSIISRPVKGKSRISKPLSGKIKKNIPAKTELVATATDENIKKTDFLFEEEVAKYIHRHGIDQYSREYRRLLNQAETDSNVESEEVETGYTEREETPLPFRSDDWVEKIRRKAADDEKEGWEAFYN